MTSKERFCKITLLTLRGGHLGQPSRIKLTIVIEPKNARANKNNTPVKKIKFMPVKTIFKPVIKWERVPA